MIWVFPKDLTRGSVIQNDGSGRPINYGSTGSRSGTLIHSILSGTDLGELWRVAEGLQLPFDLVGAGLDGHSRHVEAEGEQALLTLKHSIALLAIKLE
jgi:hypothetical protein